MQKLATYRLEKIQGGWVFARIYTVELVVAAHDRGHAFSDCFSKGEHIRLVDGRVGNVAAQELAVVSEYIPALGFPWRCKMGIVLRLDRRTQTYHSQVFLSVADEMFSSDLHTRSLHSSNLTISQNGRKVRIRRPVFSVSSAVRAEEHRW